MGRKAQPRTDDPRSPLDPRTGMVRGLPEETTPQIAQAVDGLWSMARNQWRIKDRLPHALPQLAVSKTALVNAMLLYFLEQSPAVQEAAIEAGMRKFDRQRKTNLARARRAQASPLQDPGTEVDPEPAAQEPVLAHAPRPKTERKPPNLPKRPGTKRAGGA